MRRCPYLEQAVKDQLGPLVRVRADCHVDGRTHVLLGLRRATEPCLGHYERCPMYQREKRLEDGKVRRYTD